MLAKPQLLPLSRILNYGNERRTKRFVTGECIQDAVLLQLQFLEDSKINWSFLRILNASTNNLTQRLFVIIFRYTKGNCGHGKSDRIHFRISLYLWILWFRRPKILSQQRSRSQRLLVHGNKEDHSFWYNTPRQSDKAPQTVNSVSEARL